MNWQTILYFSSILLTFILTGFLAWYAWRQPALPGVRVYAWMACSECLLALEEMLSMLGGSEELALFWFEARFIFTSIIPVFWLIFALEYNGRKEWLSKGLIASMFIVPLITQLMIWSNSLHGLWVKQNVTFHQNGFLWIAETGARIPGIWFMMHTFYSIFLLIAGSGVILITSWRQRHIYSAQALLLSMGALVSLLAGVIPIFNIFPHSEFNPFIPGIGGAALLYALAIFRYQFLTSAPESESAQRMSTFERQEKRSLVILIFIFILFTTSVIVSGYFTYQNYKEHFRKQVEFEISAIAELKVNELVNWREERLADGEVLRENPLLAALVKRFFENPADSEAREQLQAWLASYRIYDDSDRVRLVDIQGNTYLSDPAGLQPISSVVTQQIPEVLSSGQVTMVDFYRSTDQNIYLGILVPIIDESAGGRVIGLIILSIDPQIYLYPFIQEWPVPSTSAETLLIRQDGNNVVYLNPLRYHADAVLDLNFSLDKTQRPAVKAVLGEEGIVEGLDYRDEEVIADIRKVPESPWFLVSKMDTAEIYAPLRERLWLTVVFFGALIMMAGAGLLQIWRQQRVRYYKAQAEISEALRASEEKFRLAFDTSPDAVTISQLENGIFVSVNKGFEHISGYCREEVLGKSSLEIPIWKDPEDRRRLVEVLRAKGEIQNYETVLQTRNGEISVLISASIITFNNKPHILNITHDISDRKQTEAALRESEDKFKYIFDHSMIGKSITLPGGEVNVNRAFCEMLGYPAEELRNKKWQELSHPDDNEMTQKIIDSLLSGEKESARFIKRYLHKNGASVWADVSSSLRRDRDGKPLYFITSMSDITERRRAEAALRTSEEKHRLVVDQASEGIAIAQDQKIIFSNASFAAMLGYELDEMEGREFIKLIPPENMDLILERYQKRLAGEPVPTTYESVLLHKNGTRIPVEVSATLIQYEGNPADLVVIRDITERTQAEEKIKYQASLLEHINDAVIAVDSQRHITAWNQAAEGLYGWKVEEVMGKPVEEVVRSEFTDTQRTEAIKVLTETGSFRVETLQYHRNGQAIWVEGNTIILRDGLGKPSGFIAVNRDITERKQAEEALEWMRSTLAEAQKIAHMGSFEYIAATQTTAWSEEEYRIYGLDPSEPSPSYDMMLQKCIHPDDAALLHETFTKAMQSHTVYKLEHRVVRPDGSVRWVYDLAQPYFDEQGELIRYIGSTLDITERKQAEEKLHESETRYRLISENSADVIWTLDLATRRFTYVSPSVFNLRGLTPEEVMAEPMQAAITPESNEQISENLPQRIARYLSGDISARTTTKLVDQVHKDGSIIPTEAVTNLITDSEGKVVEVLGITRDITLRKKAEEALRKSQTQLQAIIDYSPSLISIKDLAGNILLANRSFDVLDAPPLHELIGKNVFDIFPKEVAEPLWNNDLAALQAKGPVRSEEVVKHKDGHWHTYWTVKFPIYLQSDQPFGICAISNDITERKQAEEQLLKTLEELKRSNNELEQFAYVASHDLQEPLRAVAGMVQLLQKRYQGKLDDRADEYITLAMDGANRMQTLIKDLLEYSRVDRRGNPIQPIDANVALKSALRNLEASIQQSGAIVTTGTLPTVDADATQLAQLFQNLIGNAIKFRSERPPKIHVEVKDLGNIWQFSVRDNGIGIEPQYFERIFLVFQRLHTRREYPGTGIGLSICKKIVDRHGGRIWIESEPGQGTTFFFTIPQRS